MKAALTYVAVGLLWLLHWLPLPFLRGLGWVLAKLIYPLAHERRNVLRTNLRLCFPDMPPGEREQLARRHVLAFSRSVIDRTLFWWASQKRVQRLARIHGIEHITEAGGGR